MVCQPLRIALLIGAITAVAVSPVRATHRAPKCCDPCGSAPVATSSNCGPTTPATRTITVTECVPETYTVKRTAYKYECRTETYDACKTECVPVTKERTVTCYKQVPVVREEVRKVAHNVTVYEDRTTMKTSYQTVQETVMKKKLVARGHWECQEVAARHGLLSGLFGGGGCGHKSACSDPCADPCAAPCTPTRTKKVWVHCPEYTECPVTVCKKVCVQTPVTCKVAVCKTEWREEKVKVCTTQCVPETRVEKYTCYESRQVTYKATRNVRVCVPYEETVNCTRMVARQVTREVPCTTSCSSPCSDPCAAPRCGLMSRLRGAFGSGCGCSGHHTAAPSCCN